MEGGCTFAVVGRNEATSLPIALGHAFDAAEPGDRVWFIDSASTDQSAAIATALGAEVVAAPIGKGRAMQAAFDRCDDGHLLFLDADYEWSERNIPAVVRAAVAQTGADMVVASYTEPARRRVVTPAVYRPLVGALVPEALAAFEVPLSGFRAVRPSVLRSPLPSGYGAETHLNLEAVLAGASVANCQAGEFRGALRGYTNIGAILEGVGGAILDLAERHGRLDPALRPEWDRWVDAVLEMAAHQPPPGGEDHAFMDELAVIATRPLPPAFSPVAD